MFRSLTDHHQGVCLYLVKAIELFKYSDTSANEDNSFRNHIRQPKSSLAKTSRCLERKQPSRVGVSRLYDVVSSFLCHTHTEGKDKLLEWPDLSCWLLYVSARIHKNIRQPNPYSLAESEKQQKKIFFRRKIPQQGHSAEVSL